MSGEFKILLEDKNEGITSFSSLGKIKKEYRGEKVGHAGTLDKFASGLMIVMIGGATKLNPVFSSFSKKYVAKIAFGEETDTLDPEGDVVATAPAPTREELEKSVNSFLGKQMQVPPVYSALHIDGKRAYEEARKGHDINMPEREIEVYSIKLLEYNEGCAVVECHVSKGTYIRSLARDIAIKCGSRAHLVALRRTQIGPWTLDDIPLDTKALLDKSDLLSVVHLKESKRRLIENGFIDQSFVISDSDREKRFAYLYFGSELFAIGEKGDKLRILSRCM